MKKRDRLGRNKDFYRHFYFPGWNKELCFCGVLIVCNLISRISKFVLCVGPCVFLCVFVLELLTKYKKKQLIKILTQYIQRIHKVN